MKSSGKRDPESGAEHRGRNFSGLSDGIEEGGVRLPARSPGVPDSAFAGKGGRRERGRERRSGESVRGCAEEAGGAAQRYGRKWNDTEGREGIGATGNSPACAAESGGVAAFVGRSLEALRLAEVWGAGEAKYFLWNLNLMEKL